MCWKCKDGWKALGGGGGGSVPVVPQCHLPSLRIAVDWGIMAIVLNILRMTQSVQLAAAGAQLVGVLSCNPLGGRGFLALA